MGLSACVTTHEKTPENATDITQISSPEEINITENITEETQEENNDKEESINGLIIGKYDYYEELEDRKISREYFEKVTNEYTYERIVEEIGKPNKWAGFGIRWELWDLEDGTEAWLMFGVNSTVETVLITDSEGKSIRIYPSKNE